MYTNKFLTFGFSALLELAGGASYAFSLYGPALKESLHYTQVELQGIGNNLLPSIALGLLPGFVYDQLQKHNRAAPRLALALGAIIHFVGYGGLWLVATHRLDAPYTAVMLLGAVAMSGASWTDIACISVNVRSFAHDRGTVLGILKSMMGLSASVLAAVYAATMQPNALGFLLFIALSVPALVALALPVFNAVPFRQLGELPRRGRIWSNSLRFTVAYSVIIVLAIAMLLASDLDESQLTSRLRAAVLTGTAVLLLPLLLLGFGSSGFWAKPDPDVAAAISAAAPEDASLLETLLPSSIPQAGDASQASPAASQESSKSAYAGSIATLNFWLLAFVFGASSANGLLFLNNCGQLVESLRGPPDGQDRLLSLFSVFNCIGRLLFGFVPELALHKLGTPRTAFLVAAASIMAATSLTTALADLSLLRLTAPICGLVYGAQWTLMPALATELFGLARFGLNYSVLTTAVSLASFLVSNLMGGYVYQARLQRHGDLDNICIGADCFRYTFLVAAGLEVLAVIAASLLYRRTKRVFEREHDEIVTEDHVIRCLATGHRLVPQRLAAARTS